MIHDIQICWKGEELTSQPIAASLKIQSYFSRIYAPERLGTGNAKSGDIDQKSLSETPENLALQDKSKVEYSHPTLRYGMRDDLYENHNFRDIWNLRLDPELAASEFKAEYFDAVVLYVYKGRCRGLNDEYGTNVRVNEDSPTWHVVHLLLQRVDDRKDVYKRIGLLHQQLDFKRSKDEVLSQIGEEKEITLI
ncbi:hypothetical protein SLS60_004298 [Paraconiothyrium brasiliense]|uniref:Uncharacterized protein n=1 Tax=Paraconiothyrium brasiliense TaxID=300254 RepID=A0ABR3RKF0_9PLEO